MSEYIVSVPDELAEEFEAHIESKQATLFGFKLLDEIIRCADCVYAHDKTDSGYWCNNMESRMQPDDFCSWGTRGTWRLEVEY